MNHNEYFNSAKLLDSLPIKRAAYSDRMAWIMAEIARLVYERLPSEMSQAKLISAIKSAVEKGYHDDELAGLIHNAVNMDKDHASLVEDVLRKANFTLLEFFDSGGTEAFLAKMDKGDEQFLVLVFRGTEQKWEDIKSDVTCDLVPVQDGGKVHRGFQQAFERVEKQIRVTLEKPEFKDLPLYITGHSLGGALALLATRYIGNDSKGATYTFGCPRAGDDAFFEKIKTPVYRVVNAADGVACIPFGSGLTVVLLGINIIPYLGCRISEWARRTIVGYTHYGDFIYLNHVENIKDSDGVPYKELKVLRSPNFFWCLTKVVTRWIATWGKAAAGDHSIAEYSMKLMAHALRRQ